MAVQKIVRDQFLQPFLIHIVKAYPRKSRLPDVHQRFQVTWTDATHLEKPGRDIRLLYDFAGTIPDPACT
jgi:hypothetical protein